MDVYMQSHRTLLIPEILADVHRWSGTSVRTIGK